jgi:hypothetical protein
MVFTRAQLLQLKNHCLQYSVDFGWALQPDSRTQGRLEPERHSRGMAREDETAQKPKEGQPRVNRHCSTSSWRRQLSERPATCGARTNEEEQNSVVLPRGGQAEFQLKPVRPVHR